MSAIQLRAGFGRADITPEPGTPLMGYNPGADRRASAVRDALTANVLLLDGDAGRTAIVSLDLCLIDADVAARIASCAADELGISASHVVVACTHTHSAPLTGVTTGWASVDEAYLSDILLPGVQSAGRSAAANVTPAQLGVGTTRSEVGINRRPLNERHESVLGQCPWEVFDPTMTVLRIESADGPVVSLVHYAAHPTVLNPSSTVVSRDWPGVMIDRLEKASGGPAMFINACSESSRR